MSRRVLQLIWAIVPLLLVPCVHSMGPVVLDEIIFDKIVSRFPVAVVKFDIAFPYGEKHDQFTAFAKEQNPLVQDLIIADVHVKDYGDKDNFSLLKRFGISDKELPAILLFKSSAAPQQKWKRYPREKDITVDNLKNFVRTESKLYIGLSGCIESFDRLAGQFMAKFASNEFGDMDALIEQATSLLSEITDDDYKHRMGSVYLQVMRKIREKGISFKADEKSRITKLLNTKLSPTKQKELRDRLNILLSFQDTAGKASGEEKSEL